MFQHEIRKTYWTYYTITDFNNAFAGLRFRDDFADKPNNKNIRKMSFFKNGAGKLFKTFPFYFPPKGVAGKYFVVEFKFKSKIYFYYKYNLLFIYINRNFVIKLNILQFF